MKEGGLDRRQFLKHLTATATVVSLAETGKFLSALAEDSGAPESANFRQRALDETIDAVRANLKHPEVQGALEGRSRDIISTVLRAVEAPILPHHLKGTSYDVDELHRRYPVQIARSGDPASRERYKLTSSWSPAGDFKYGGYGNGVYYNSELLLTNGHVTATVIDNATPTRWASALDIGVIRATGAMRAPGMEHVVDERGVTSADINGAFVAVTGIDPDATSEAGRKTYPGVAIKVTPALAKALAGGDEDGEAKFRRSFMMVLPPGETKLDPRTSGKPVSGMSGSPVFVQKEGSYCFAGVFWGSWTANVGNQCRTVDIGFFYGIDEVHEALETTRIRTLS